MCWGRKKQPNSDGINGVNWNEHSTVYEALEHSRKMNSQRRLRAVQTELLYKKLWMEYKHLFVCSHA